MSDGPVLRTQRLLMRRWRDSDLERFEAHFTTPRDPATEIGWRLARRAWGHGYASEAARRALEFALRDAGMHEIVSFTSAANARSQAVMRRIGMIHDPADDFDHPLFPEGHRLRRHVLYRLSESHRRAAL